MAEPIVTNLGISALLNQSSTLLTDVDSSNINSLVIESDFNLTVDLLQGYLYDSNQNFIDRITTGYDVITLPEAESVHTLALNPGKDLISNGYNKGSYQVSYNFVSPLIVNNPNLFISEISLDRTELKINSNALTSPLLKAACETILEDLNSTETFEGFYLDFGSNQLEFAINTGFTDNSLLVKLYQPLNESFTTGATFNILRKKADSSAFLVQFPAEEVSTDNLKYLRGPNLNLKVSTQTSSTTDFKSLNTLTSGSTAGLTNQLSSVLAENRAELNIDFTEYSNFTFFSSAKTRLNNFNYKVTLLEDYNNQIITLNGLINTPALELSSSKAFYENEIKTITKNFDGYDYYLFYSSGSKAWPKQNTEQPYTLFSYSSSEATNWIEQQAVTASEYDIENRNNLYEIFPTYITNDSDNSQFKLFTELTAQMFDEIWVYTKALENRQDGDNSLTGGISIDLVADALKSYGLDIYESSFSNSNLFTGLLGITETGGTLPPTGSELINTYVTASAQTTPSNDAQKLIYKRLYHNLPYLLKKKGTTAGLRVLLNCFGIPDTILRISEFGGKDKNANTWDYWYNQYNYNYNTSGSGYIQTPWDGSNFVSTWISASPITLPLTSNGTYNMIVNWGDGTAEDTITAWNDTAKTHNYVSPGEYDITIRGTVKGFSFNNLGYAQSLLDIKEWGPLQLNNSASFYGCNELGKAANNFTITATDRPAILTTTLENSFRDTTNLSGSLSNWKIANVTSLKNTFRNSPTFNTPLYWDTINVSTLEGTFKDATSFNQPLNWSTTAVTSVSGTFARAYAYNHPISWNLNTCFNFNYMFEDALSFNSTLNLLTTTGGTFEGMFKGARVFNQDLNNLDFSSATTFKSMFENAISFNTSVMGWNTSNVADTSTMFAGATSFNQDLSSWNISSLTDATDMFTNSGLDTTNYDALLIGWAAQAQIQPNVNFGAAGIKYTTLISGPAHSLLTSAPYNWTITDGGGI
jgi:hypothetical protein